MTHYLSRRRQVRTLAWFAVASLASLLVLVALYQAFSFAHDGPSSFHPYLASVREPPPPPVPVHSCTTCKPVSDDGFFCQGCEFDKPPPVVKPPTEKFVASYRHTFIEQYLSNHTLLFDCRDYHSWCHDWMYSSMDVVLQDTTEPLSLLSVRLLSLFCILLCLYALSAFFVVRYLLAEQRRIKLAERSDREAERDTINRRIAAQEFVAGSGLVIDDEATSGLRQRMLAAPSSSF